MWELTPVIPASAGWGHQDSEFLGQFGINQQDPISKKEGVRSDEEFGWGLLTSRPLLPVQFGSLAFLTSWLPCRQNRDPRERKCKLLKSWVSFGLWFLVKLLQNWEGYQRIVAELNISVSPTFPNTLKKKLLLDMHGGFACMELCIPLVCVVFMEIRRGHLISWSHR